MSVTFGRRSSFLPFPLFSFALLPLFLGSFSLSAPAQQISAAAQRAHHSPALAAPPTAGNPNANANSNANVIPAGTILPIRLPSISSAKLKKGDTIRCRLAQDVPLPGAGKIHEGATILATVLSTTPAAPATPATLAIKFDTLVQHGKSTPIQTDLRAMASMLEVQQAQIPTTGAGESDVYDWLSTQQVGGDVVYGKGGLVVAAHDKTVGTSDYGNGVLVQVLANAQGGCRGALAGDDRPQALWVFSAAACGLYGFPDLKIRHAGRTTPFGEIVLESTKGPVRIRSGSGALLRVASNQF
jgi:hypothetical protein